jgi:hypothetical protein
LFSAGGWLTWCCAADAVGGQPCISVTNSMLLWILFYWSRKFGLWLHSGWCLLLAHLLTMRMEAIHSTSTLMNFYWATWCHISEVLFNEALQLQTVIEEKLKSDVKPQYYNECVVKHLHRKCYIFKIFYHHILHKRFSERALFLIFRYCIFLMAKVKVRAGISQSIY